MVSSRLEVVKIWPARSPLVVHLRYRIAQQLENFLPREWAASEEARKSVCAEEEEKEEESILSNFFPPPTVLLERKRRKEEESRTRSAIGQSCSFQEKSWPAPRRGVD